MVTTDTSEKKQERADAITIETTAYALLTAVTLKKTTWADKAACWLISQENYFGGFRSSQVNGCFNFYALTPSFSIQ